jgi:hypothetical protein
MDILIPQTLPGDDTAAVIGLSSEEVAALMAAGRAAGYSDLKSVIYGVLDDAIGIGCRVLRAEEDVETEIAAARAQLGALINEITNGDSPLSTPDKPYLELHGTEAALHYGFEHGMKENMHRGTRRLKEAIALGNRLKQLTKNQFESELECTLAAYSEAMKFDYTPSGAGVQAA